MNNNSKPTTKEALYTDLINLIIKVSNHMPENHKVVKKGVKDNSQLRTYIRDWLFLSFAVCK
jgi:hypothetical protein